MSRLKVLATLAALVLGSSAHGQEYADRFNAPALDSYWSTNQQSGSLSLSSAQVRSGARSLRLASTDTGLSKGIEAYHVLPEPIFGRVSVWVYDTGADEFSSNYISLFLSNSADGTFASIGTTDYDLGPSNGGTYNFGIWTSAAPIHTTIDRTKAWHLWEIESTSDFLSIQIDGQIVLESSAGRPIERVALAMFGPSWRPAWNVYFDDFGIAQAADCPGDVDHSREVDLDDLLVVLGNFGVLCP